jgi:ABC-type nitrate/sulfonate/bicarbonate transport system substrate-binding protein
MGFVLADQQGWLSSSSSSGPPYSDTVVLNTFENLRNAVNSGEADFFMWEHFTSKRYYDSGEIRKVGEIYTPWSSWKIVASTRLGQEDERTKELFEKLDQGVKYFNGNQEEAVKYISTALDYSDEDAREWLKTVRFPEHTSGVDVGVIKNTVEVLRKAGVLTQGKGLEPETMVAKAC